ncbi:hypothetical protein VPHK469_0025 [Vibrio phage K469]
MKVTPRTNHVLVDPKDFQNVTTSGLVMSSGSETKEFTAGTIMAVGPDVSNDLTVGLNVSFVIGVSGFEKAETVDGKKMYILPEQNIVGVVHVQ